MRVTSEGLEWWSMAGNSVAELASLAFLSWRRRIRIVYTFFQGIRTIPLPVWTREENDSINFKMVTLSEVRPTIPA